MCHVWKVVAKPMLGEWAIKGRLSRGSKRLRVGAGGSILMWRVFLVAVVCSGFVGWSAKAESNVQVKYVHPENFTDVSFRGMTRQDAESRLERELTGTIERAAMQYLGDYGLEVRILDVAMAGREAFEQPGFNSDLRIRNSMGKPARISIQYELKEPAGRVVAKGARVLTNLAYQRDYPDTYLDTLSQEKQLLRDWIRGLPRETRKPVVQETRK